MMSAMVLATLAAAALLIVSTQETRVDLERRRLRATALAAAEVTLGRLGSAVGRDVGFTYVGLDSTLKAGREEERAGFDGAWTDDASGVRVEVRVEDLSQTWDERAAALSVARATAWAKSRLGRQALSAGPVTAALSADSLRALELGERELYHQALGDRPLAGTGWGGAGLLTNPVRGGWRRNFSDAATLTASIGPDCSARLLTPPAAFAADPSVGLPPTVLADGAFGLVHAPVLVDFRLSLGFFNARSDGRHRLRFHGSGRWWNPSAAPVLADSNQNLYLVEVDGAPEVEVRNLDTQAGFTVYLDDCPVEDFGIISQGLREQGLWLWANVADGQTYGMARRGLLPGEVYGFITPNPSSQPQGLARILTKSTWRMDNAVHGPAWVRPSPEVFRPTDRIALAVRFRSPVTLRLRPANGQPPADQAIRDYPSPPQLVIANVPFPDFLIETSGGDYSREDSAGYTLSERRACLRVSLRERAAAEWLAGARSGWLLKTSWDLSDPADAAEWVVANPLLSALDAQEWPMRPTESVLWDRVANAHAGEEPGAFARLMVRDIPAAPLSSVAGLQVLLPEPDLRWAAWLDDAFVGAPAVVGGISDHPRLIVADPSPWAAKPDLRAADAASRVLVAGAFNVNSRDVDAWERMLTSAPYVWSANAGGPVAASPLAGSWFCTLPSGAQSATYGVSTAVNATDDQLAESTADALREVVGQQAMRALPAATTRRWAECIVEQQVTQGWPYASMESFVRSGILDKSLAAAGVNACLGPAGVDGPSALRGAHILRAFGPLLTVRGDTYRIFARAIDPRGGSVEVEWVVQRVADEQAIPALGRRFRVIRSRIGGG
jgi:hypothetical protein